MSAQELEAWLGLLRLPGLGPTGLVRLIEAHGSAQAARSAGLSSWRALGLSDAALQSLQTVPGSEASLVAADLAWLAGAPDRHFVHWNHPAYPALLRYVDSPPAALFCVGDPALLGLPQLAIVGSRNASPAGLAIAEDFAQTLCGRGLVVTSGLASGIDGAAHRGALAASGLTVAVCATGLDRVYPATHRQLAHQIAARGLLVSEFAPGVKPRPEFFPRRNRIISGLSLGVLVVEAALESGSLITAGLAAEQGREVFAIPGSIHNPMARGCHRLIRTGAKLVECVEDILEELTPALSEAAARSPSRASPPEPVPSDRKAAESGPEAEPDREPGGLDDAQMLYQALGFDPLAADEVAGRLGWSPGRLASALLALELSGRAASVAGDRLLRIRV